jgi:hypothetical protein
MIVQQVPTIADLIDLLSKLNVNTCVENLTLSIEKPTDSMFTNSSQQARIVETKTRIEFSIEIVKTDVIEQYLRKGF